MRHRFHAKNGGAERDGAFDEVIERRRRRDGGRVSRDGKRDDIDTAINALNTVAANSMKIIPRLLFATSARKSRGFSTPKSLNPFATTAAAVGLNDVCNTRVISSTASMSSIASFASSFAPSTDASSPIASIRVLSSDSETPLARVPASRRRRRRGDGVATRAGLAMRATRELVERAMVFECARALTGVVVVARGNIASTRCEDRLRQTYYSRYYGTRKLSEARIT